MTLIQEIITIAACAMGSAVTRFLPFAIFNGKRPTPKYVTYLGHALPPAIFGMLIVYCFRNVNFLSAASHHGIPDLIALAATVATHLWKKNMMLSMLVGTALYMFLVQAVFI